MRKRVEQFDATTGEVLTGCLVLVPRKMKFTEPFLMFFQNSFKKIASDRSMTGESLRVLIHLFSVMEFENSINYSQRDIAEALGMRSSHVSRALKLLMAKDIIFESRKTCNVKLYKFNPDFVWKGRIKNLLENKQ